MFIKMKINKICFAFALGLLSLQIHAYPENIKTEMESIETTYKNKMMALFSIRYIDPQRFDPIICKNLNEYIEGMVSILERNQQYLDEEERAEINSGIFLKNTIDEGRQSLGERQIHCLDD